MTDPTNDDFEQITEMLASDDPTPDADETTAKALASILNALITRSISIYIVRRAFRRFGIELSRAQVSGLLATAAVLAPRNPTEANLKSVKSLSDALLPIVRSTRVTVEDFILARASKS